MTATAQPIDPEKGGLPAYVEGAILAYGQWTREAEAFPSDKANEPARVKAENDLRAAILKYAASRASREGVEDGALREAARVVVDRWERALRDRNIPTTYGPEMRSLKAALVHPPAPVEARAASDEPEVERVAREIRAAWVEWATRQPNAKPSWLVPWDECDEQTKDADRYLALRVLIPAIARNAPAPVETSGGSPREVERAAREVIAKCAVPLEVLAGQIAAKRYTEITGPLQDEIVASVKAMRALATALASGANEGEKAGEPVAWAAVNSTNIVGIHMIRATQLIAQQLADTVSVKRREPWHVVPLYRALPAPSHEEK